MNERIRELAQEAEAYADYYAIIADELEKNIFIRRFAELIVRECAEVAFNDWCDGTNEGSSQMAILKHFGVEE